MGFYHYWECAEKKGYSGVATFSKIKPTFHEVGMGLELYDREGRVLRTDFGDLSVLNCYFPSGGSGELRQDFKYKFLEDFSLYIQKLKETRSKIIVVGDYNIAHQEIDIHNPKGNKKSSGFLPEERAWMTQWLESGFTDAYRTLHPELQTYTWWSYRANARARDKGWRIDYQCVTDNLKEHIISVRHASEAMHSDHCPVVVNYKKII